MTPARRRLLLAAAVGAVVLGPALALSLYSLQALSVEQARLADEARAARLHRLRHGGQVTHERCTTLANELARAAALTDGRARDAALRAVLDDWGDLAAGLLQVGPGGDVLLTGGRVLVPAPEPPPTDTDVAAAFEPIRRLEWGRGRVAADPAAAAEAYARLAEKSGVSRGLAARAWAAAARAAMTSGQPLRALRYCDAALGHGGALATQTGGGWYAYAGDGGFPLAWTLLGAKIDALSALIEAERAPALQVPYRVERGTALTHLAELLAQNEMAVPEAGLAVFVAVLQAAGGPEAAAYYAQRRAARAALAASRPAVARWLQTGGDRPRLIVAGASPPEVLVLAPLPGLADRGGLAVPLRPEALGALFAEAVAPMGAMEDETYRLVGPDGVPLASGAVPSGDPTEAIALPEEFAPLRAAVWAPRGGGAIGAVELLTRRAYWGLAIATVVAFAGGLLLFARVLTREVRLARMRADFVSSVTHELRTPLTSIQMFVETLLLGRVSGTDETRECLEVIGREAGRLRRLVDRVLSFARTERGDRVFELRPEPVERLVQGAVRLFSVADEGRRRAVEVHVARDCPPVRADRDAIEEVLLNLLTNAAKYSPPHTPIAVRATRENGHVAVRVTDQGMGIPASELDRVFEGFYRGERARERGIPGTGIGLALSRKIARAHGGDLTVQSAPDAGATFTLALPPAVPAPPAPSAPVSEAPR